ncbi:unnamed protein product [Coffea canephora]|uniref:Uncharacterized protein n=1 Tax=Coffea canephora TaxID=49390 RepID=A0A068U7X8_COFCA|nr:unnamed protein product [Coffea canephora]
MEASLEVALEEARLEVLRESRPSSESSPEGTSGDFVGLLLEDWAFSLPCLLRYLPSSSKMVGLCDTNSAILAMASSLLGWVLWDPGSSEMWSCWAPEVCLAPFEGTLPLLERVDLISSSDLVPTDGAN